MFPADQLAYSDLFAAMPATLFSKKDLPQVVHNEDAAGRILFGGTKAPFGPLLVGHQ